MAGNLASCGGQPASIMASRGLSCSPSDARMAMRSKGDIARRSTRGTGRGMIYRSLRSAAINAPVSYVYPGTSLTHARMSEAIT